MHEWGNEGVDWAGIENAAQYIDDFCVRWGRIPVRSSKEKYGTVRVYCSLGWYNLLSITHPKYIHYGPYPKWLSKFDIFYGPKILKYSGLAFFSRMWHPFVYRLAYKRALKKWPHLVHEILCCADFEEYLQDLGYKFGGSAYES